MRSVWTCGLSLVFAAVGAMSLHAADDEYSPELKAVLAKEKTARKACKVDLCSALRNKAPGDDIKCAIIKTVPKQDLSKKIKRARVSWPWGHARCEMTLNIARQMLIDAVSKPEYEAKFSAHTLNCTVARKAEGKSYDLSATVTPTIAFKDGKAVKGSLEWGTLKAPLAVKGALWTATALDNKANVFGDDLVEAMNTFMGKKCDEVKAEWKSG